MALGDVADRLTISRLKLQYGLATEVEVQAYADEVEECGVTKTVAGRLALAELECANRAIWALEYAIKTGRDESLPLEEIGRRALEIRDWNRRRVAARNAINGLTGTGYQEVKGDHASA
jgi:hypothetical protein